jgi:hypothetical protein
VRACVRHITSRLHTPALSLHHSSVLSGYECGRYTLTSPSTMRRLIYKHTSMAWLMKLSCV